MSKGIIYVMETAVPGLIKIGKTGSDKYENRMYNLEHDGYRNVTALKRRFAIEVEEYSEKERLLHTIFEKSRVADTELFALDINVVVKLLASFDGTVVFPKSESKAEIFDEANANSEPAKDASDAEEQEEPAQVKTKPESLIPNGVYTFIRYKKSDQRTVSVKARVRNGYWTLLKGGIVGLVEDKGVSEVARKARESMPVDGNGVLCADYDLGRCSPSFAGTVVMNQSNNGWTDWKNKDNLPLDIYREKTKEQQ